MKLALDDLREFPEDVTVIRTFDEAMNYITEHSLNLEVEILYLDHDLGDEKPNHTGKDFLQELFDLDIRPIRINLVTSNPVGLHYMGLMCSDNGYVKYNSRLYYDSV